MKPGPIEDYAALKAAVLRFLQRADLDEEVADFIMLGEQRLCRDLALRGTLAQQTTVLPVGHARVTLPSDYLSFIRAWRGPSFQPDGRLDHGWPTWEELEGLRWEDLRGTWSDPHIDPRPKPGAASFEEIKWVDPEVFVSQPTPGAARTGTIVGHDWVLERPVEAPTELTLMYVRKVRLSEEQPRNAILRDYPDVYLYAALLETPLWTHQEGWLAIWQDRYERAIASVQAVESRSNRSVLRRSDDLLRLLR